MLIFFGITDFGVSGQSNAAYLTEYCKLVFGHLSLKRLQKFHDGSVKLATVVTSDRRIPDLQ